jgi:hydrogenase maturation protein HypF
VVVVDDDGDADVSGSPDVATAVRFEVTGIVQGVGFRPFVHRLAMEGGLRGFVGNDSTRVFIEVAGPASCVDAFERRLEAEQPPLAQIHSIVRSVSTATISEGFSIVESEHAAGERTLIPPDTAPCGDCRREMTDPTDRRFLHPFISCTNCGPRFTIVTDLPYDRPATTMADFAMCAACRAEYVDPTNRRFHAQPIACHDCGPHLEFRAVDGLFIEADTNPIRSARVAIGGGATVAIKGVGGYQLACDATSDTALAVLRSRKARPDKPFAIMVADLEAARRLAHVSAAEATQLMSPARPIVLLQAGGAEEVSALVAPGSPLLGIMLPSSPIHELLFTDGAATLVMTSGNLSGEPIIHDDAEAHRRLAPLCDAFLTHDRRVQVPVDDSVVRVVGDRLLPIRRARGFAPIPIDLGGGQRSVLAVGGELKNAFCLASTEHAWMSQHIGDMENLETLDAFESTLAGFMRMYGVLPDVVAVDAHPGYLTSKWARAQHPDRIVEVQHHHSHVAAVMAEHECDPHQPVLGIAFDGTGYGDDGTIWGGEVLVATVDGYDRVAHLAPIDLPGGDAAVRHPSRVALAYLRAAGIEWADDLAPMNALSQIERRLLRQQLDRRVACVPATSMGRLFDAIASLLGLRHDVSYEAQAAIDLEVAASAAVQRDSVYRFDLASGLIDPRRVLESIVADLRSRVPVSEIAWGFHDAVSAAVVDVVVATWDRHGEMPVALTGGVFQNALLSEHCIAGLAAVGCRPLTHHLVPPNDGGLALGQAFIAAHRTTISPTSSPTSKEL